jgi:hypothetical protein
MSGPDLCGSMQLDKPVRKRRYLSASAGATTASNDFVLVNTPQCYLDGIAVVVAKSWASSQFSIQLYRAME